jgi:hypothetical protein
MSPLTDDASRKLERTLSSTIARHRLGVDLASAPRRLRRTGELEPPFAPSTLAAVTEREWIRPRPLQRTLPFTVSTITSALQPSIEDVAVDALDMSATQGGAVIMQSISVGRWRYRTCMSRLGASRRLAASDPLRCGAVFVQGERGDLTRGS